MRILSIIFIFSISIFSAFAQFPHPDTSYFFLFGNSNIDEFRDGCNHSIDSGYVMVGTTSSFSTTGSDIYLVKTDWTGKTLWSRIIGGAAMENGFSIKETPDKGFIIGGFTNSSSNQDYDMLLVKTDSQGFVQWQKTFGGPDWDFLYSVALCPDSGYVLCGETYSFGNLSSDIYLLRTDKNGDTVWTKTFGGPGKDAAKKVILTSDGSLVSVGYTESNSAGMKDLYLIKCNYSTGDSIFSIKKGGMYNDEANSVVEHTAVDSGYVIVGYSESFTSAHDKNFWYLKFNKNGSLMWEDNYWNNGGDDEGTGIVCDGLDFFASGYTANGSGFGDITATTINLAGFWLWSQSTDYGSYQADRSWSNFKSLRNHFVLIGSTQSFNSIDQNALIILLDTIKPQPQKVTISSDSLVSMAEYSNFKLKCFPNPANDYFYVSTKKILEFDSKLFINDLSGNLVYKTYLTKGQQDFFVKIDNLPNGIYSLLLENNSEIIRGKLMVQR